MSVLGAIAVLGLFTANVISAQMTVTTIAPASGQQFGEIALYQGGDKLFVIDTAGAQILVYDARSLAPAGQIPFASYWPDKPQGMAVHEGSGTLFVAISGGYATSDTRMVVVDAETLEAGPVVSGLGWDAILTLDEPRSRL